jgi:hypothetical protein
MGVETLQAFVMMEAVAQNLKHSWFVGMRRLWTAPFDMSMLVTVMKSRDQAHIPKPHLRP